MSIENFAIRNNLEAMIHDCEESGKEFITPMLTPEDARTILEALSMLSSCEIDSKTRRPIMRVLDFRKSDLGETVVSMTSKDYKERFKAEYIQTKIRYEKLKDFNTRIEAAQSTANEFGPVSPVLAKVEMPKHDCPERLLREQQSIMGQYLHILEVRAVIEGVDIGCC